MSCFVAVGGVVVGSFDNQMSALKFCVKQVAPGCNPQIKKTPPSYHTRRGKCSNEARHVTNQIGNYKRVPPLLKPGEFTL